MSRMNREVPRPAPRPIEAPHPESEGYNEFPNAESFHEHGVTYDMQHLTNEQRSEVQRINDTHENRNDAVNALFDAGYYPGPMEGSPDEATEMTLYWNEDPSSVTLEVHNAKYGEDQAA